MVKTINRINSKIYIGDADDVGTELSTSYETYISNINISGGEFARESVDTFSGNLSNDKSQSGIEIKFDVVLTLDTNSTIWHNLLTGQADHVVAIQAGNSTDGYFWKAYNNARVTLYDSDFSASEYWKGSVTIKLTAVDEEGNENYVEKYHATADITDGSNGLLATDWGNS